MKASFFWLLTLVAVLGACGTRPTETDQRAEVPAAEHEHGEPAPHGVEFKEGKGLIVPARTSQIIGLKIVDVGEGKATRRIDIALRVFKREERDGRSFLLASGSVARDEAARLAPGAEVITSAEGQNPQRGEIASIEKNSAKLTGLAEVIVRIPDSDRTQVGAFVDGRVTITNTENVVVIPKKALLKTAEGSFTYVVNGDSLFRARIDIGGQDGDLVEVTDGLYTGDQVVLDPVMTLWLAELQAIRGGEGCADQH